MFNKDEDAYGRSDLCGRPSCVNADVRCESIVVGK